MAKINLVMLGFHVTTHTCNLNNVKNKKKMLTSFGMCMETMVCI